MRNKRKGNFDIYAGFPFFTPGFRGCLVIMLLFLGGMLLGAIAAAPVLLIYGGDKSDSTILVQLISYPIMFIPAMIYASLQSKKNSFFEKGYQLDSNNFGKLGFWKAAGLATILAIAGGIVLDIVGYVLPEMPDRLREAMEALTGGNFFLDFICVSIFAPVFEEWLCRGEILRGLLNYRRKDGGEGIKPVWAIVISAAVFALIHGNIWQAAVAFIIGVAMGFVYYKTGSLKLTMIMHFVNNTLSLVLTQIDSLKDYDYYIDMMGARWYWLAFVASAILIFLIIRKFNTIECKRPQGNCDIVDPSDIENVNI